MNKTQMVGSLKKGDFVKLRGWKRMKQIAEVIDRGTGWVAAMVNNGKDLEYVVIEDWKLENIRKTRGFWW